MSIIPSKKPVFNYDNVEKVFRYFFGDNWKETHPVFILAIRNPKIQFYDDEGVVWTKYNDKFTTFNMNTEPSAFILKGIPKAILRTGVFIYTLSYHHKYENAKRYIALRPATPREEVPVWRKNAAGQVFSSTGQAINIHQGGLNSTWSEGCQTIPTTQYPEFINTVARGLGIAIKTGIIRTPDQYLYKGVGKIPYILLTQQQYIKIMKTPESNFDNAEDIKFQSENFVGVPKIQKVVPKMEEVQKGDQILDEVEMQSIENNSIVESEPVQNSAPDSQSTDNQSTEIKVDGQKIEIKQDNPPATPTEQDKVAIEKPETEDFLSSVKNEIVAGVTGDTTITGLAAKAQDANFLWLPYWFWYILIAVVISGSVAYLVIRWKKHKAKEARDLELTNILVQANSTDSNKVVFFSKDEEDVFKKRGYKLVYR